MTDAAPAPQKPSPMAAGGAMSAFVPQDSAQLLNLAKVLANSGDMIPKHFQGRPEAITAAMLRGLEVGLPPMQALSSIAVINGRATIWGDALPALMQRAGHHVDVTVEGDGDAMRAVATLTRGDTGKTITRTFSAADAKRAGLLDKPGPWQQYRARMLSHRARTYACRDGAADALMGLQISEEVQDYGPEVARDVTPAAPRRGGVMYRPAVTHAAPAPTPEPAETPHDAHGEVIEHAEPAAEAATEPGPAAVKLIARINRAADAKALSLLRNSEAVTAEVDAMSDDDAAAVTAAYSARFDALAEKEGAEP